MIGLIKKMLGDKSTRDLKTIKPILDKTLAAYKDIKKLDNDSLRAKTNEFKQRIADHIADEINQVESLRRQVEEAPDMDSSEKEKIYNQ